MRKIKNKPDFFLNLAGVCLIGAMFLGAFDPPLMAPLFIGLLVAAVICSGFCIYYDIRRVHDRDLNLQKKLNDILKPPTQ